MFNTQNHWISGIHPVIQVSSFRELQQSMAVSLALSHPPSPLPPPEDGKWVNSQNIVFPSYLRFWMMDKLQIESDSRKK
jgi:hypothetical protein